jgi:transposase
LAQKWDGKLDAVALEATTGWRWVARELQERGIDVRLTDPGRASALQGNRRRPKTDRLDARCWSRCWRARCCRSRGLRPRRSSACATRSGCARRSPTITRAGRSRPHAVLVHEGWPCLRGSLLTDSGRRWVAAIRLHPEARAQVEAMLSVMTSVAHQIDLIECELRRIAKRDERVKALQTIFGVGPILAWTILAEIGDAQRFRRARQVVRAAGLDPVVKDSADKQRRGHLAKQGPPTLRWALVEAAQHACRKNSPDHQLYRRHHGHAGANAATLTVARKIGKRAFHVSTRSRRRRQPRRRPPPERSRVTGDAHQPEDPGAASSRLACRSPDRPGRE